MTRYRPTVAVVDLDAIRDNVRLLKPEAAELMAVVKANGYGHGAIPVARAALVAEAARSGLEVEGLWTHFATSEDLEDPFTALQLKRFRDVVERLGVRGIRPRYLHAANSGGALGHPEARLDLIRVGIAMYG